MLIKILFGDVRDGKFFSAIQKFMVALVVFSKRLPLAEFVGALDAAYQKKIDLYHQIRAAYGCPSRAAAADWSPVVERLADYERELSELFKVELYELPERLKVSVMESKINNIDIDPWELASLAKFLEITVTPDDEMQKLRDKVATLEAMKTKTVENAG